MNVNSNPALNVAIIGSGNIGTDLLIKIIKSPWLQCALFVGRDPLSKGLAKARSLGVAVSERSIDAVMEVEDLDLVFDATSAHYHLAHAPRLLAAGIKAIDMTPAKVGVLCVPALNVNAILQAPNVNMVTCGGQASIPVITALTSRIPGIRQVNVHSLLAEDSVGPGTLANIDAYYSTTAAAIREFSGVPHVDVSLEVEKSRWKPDMLTTIRAQVDNCPRETLFEALQACLDMVRTYVPGYNIVGTPRYENGVIEILVSVRGAGDWIPSHAGNLDIINCAAIAVAEKYARFVFAQRSRQQRDVSEFDYLVPEYSGLKHA